MEQLTIVEKRAVTESGMVGVVMRIVTGTSVDDDGVKSHYFNYKTDFFQPPTRIEWDADGMEAVLPANVGDFLVKKGYARPMSGSEVRAYNRSLKDSKPKEGETK